MYKLIIYLSLFACTAKNSACQSRDTSNTLSNVIKDISYFWKKDSLGNNGARLYSYKKILNARNDSISAELLLKYLGRPNETRSYTSGVTYVYLYLDMKAMPRGYPSIYAGWYVCFIFGVNREKLLGIYEGDIDY
jgi:hypothetical protein